MAENEQPGDDQTRLSRAGGKILGVTIHTVEKKVRKRDKRRAAFHKAIAAMEKFHERALILEDLGLDMSSYDEPIVDMLENFLDCLVGRECTDLINFYVKYRFDEEGNIRALKTKEGEPFFLYTPDDLWTLLILQSEYELDPTPASPRRRPKKS